MSFLGMVTQMGVVKAGKVDNTLTNALIHFDPDTAEQVDINNLKAKFNNFGNLIAAAEPEEERTHKIVTGLEASLQRDIQAAQMLSGEITAANTAGNSSLAAEKSATLATVVGLIKDIGGGPPADGSVSGKLFEARQAHALAESDLHDLQGLHAGFATKVTTAETRLNAAKADMARADRDMVKAKARQEMAEQVAGLTQGVDGNDTALKAMEANVAAAKQKSRAYILNAQALTTATSASASGEDIVNKVLSGTGATTASPQDELAALLGKAA